MNEIALSILALLPLWTVDLGDAPEPGYSRPVIVGERIYLTANQDAMHTVFCLDLDGKPVWQFLSGPGWTDLFPGTRGTPLVVNGLLYDESPHGELVCLDAASGELRWRRNLLHDYETPNVLYGRSGSLVRDGDRLFSQLGGERGSMLCLDRHTGKTLWLAESTGHAAGYGTPVSFQYEGLPLMAAMDAKGVFVVHRQSGQLQFHIRHPARLDENIFNPIYHDGALLVSNGAGSDTKCFKLVRDGESVQAKELWTNQLLANAHGGVTLIDDRLYGSTNKRGGGFACIRWKDGTDVFLDRKITRGSFALEDGLFYILTEFGELVVAKPRETDFDVLFRLELSGAKQGQAYSHPVVQGNRLYVRIGTMLYCFEIVKTGSR